jgi:hypothetical protein
MSIDVDALAQKMIEAVKGYVASALGGIVKRADEVSAQLSALQQKFEALPAPQPGANGLSAYELALQSGFSGSETEWLASLRGRDGLDADLTQARAELSEQVSKAIAELPTPKDGADATPEQIDVAVRAVLEEWPRPENGKDVDPEFVRTEILSAVAALPRAQDGKDATDEQVRAIVGPEVERAVAALPKPKDGESIHPDTIKSMVLEEVQRVVMSMPKPKDGEPGRDATQIDPLPSIDESRSYPRGTWASHYNGLIRATRTTDPVVDGRLVDAGWMVVTEGVAAIVVSQREDPREVEVAALLTSGVRAVAEFRIPMILDRGVWKEGREYEQGDSVTWNGQTSIAQCKTTEKPDLSQHWRLSVRRGRDGKDAGDAPRAREPVRLR